MVDARFQGTRRRRAADGFKSICPGSDINSLILRNGFIVPYGRAPQRDFCQVERRQPACKPGSVRPERPRGRAVVTAIPLGRSLPTASSNLPGWRGRKTGPSPCGLHHPYSVLLPAGLAMPLPLPEARCALTAPFHPYPASGAVCFLWRYPWGHPRRTLSGAVSPWSPDFPPRERGGRPADWHGWDMGIATLGQQRNH